MKNWTIVLMMGLLPFMALGQEMVYPPTVHTDLSKEKVKSAGWNAQFKTDEQIELPFFDDFTVDRFPGNADGRQVLWEGRQASINTGRPINPPSFGVVSFDGADEFGYPYSWSTGNGPADTLTSCPINLEGNPDDGMGISFYFQAKGNSSSSPGATDSLKLEFYAPDLDQWFWIWSTVDSADPDSFKFVYIPIVQDKYLKEGFQFRFRNFAWLQGAFSNWNVDYVWVDLNANNQSVVNNDVTFSRQENTLFTELTAIPRDHYAIAPASHMLSDIRVEYRNLFDGPRTLAGNAIRLVDLSTDTEVGNYPNINEPGIQGQSVQEYVHNVNAPPNNIVYDPNISATNLSVGVEFLHTVGDFGPSASNDTMRFTQTMFTHYAYDDGSAEAAYAVPTAGAEVLMRYDNLKNDSVFAIQIYTMPLGFDFENTPFTIQVWSDEGGIPGTILGEAQKTVVFGIESYQESIIYSFEEPVYVPQGSFFAGYKQSSQTEGMRVGLDYNTNGNEGNLVYRESTNWLASQIEGTAMIRPMFTSNGYEELLLSNFDLDISDLLLVYPNPARETVFLKMDIAERLEARVYDMTGRMVDQFNFSSNTSLDVSAYQNGIYLLEFQNEIGGRGVKKLVVNH